MKQLLYVGLFSMFLTNCMTSKKYSKIVNNKIESLELLTNESKDWLIINSVIEEPRNNIFIQRKNSFVPAILFWGWNSTIECEFNAQTKTKFLISSINKAADSLHLKDYLKGNSLEIRLKQMPGKFLYENKGKVIIFIIGYTLTAVETISPYAINLECEFEEIKKEDIKISGKTYIQNREIKSSNLWKSSKKFTWQYIDNYKIETERMGTELVSNIIRELTNNHGENN